MRRGTFVLDRKPSRLGKRRNQRKAPVETARTAQQGHRPHVEERHSEHVGLLEHVAAEHRVEGRATAAVDDERGHERKKF